VPNDAVVGIARHAEDPRIWACQYEALGEAGAAHLGHHHVREQQIDFPGVTLADEESLSRVLSLDHVVTLSPQDTQDDGSNLLLILDEEDGLFPAKGHRGDGRGGHVDFGIDAWQVDLERRPLLRLAVDPDVAAALLNDPEHGRP
jgi:hypothetical protein